MPATIAGLPRVSFFFSFLLLQPLTLLMKQTRLAVRAVKQSIFLDVYGYSRKDQGNMLLKYHDNCPVEYYTDTINCVL